MLKTGSIYSGGEICTIRHFFYPLDALLFNKEQIIPQITLPIMYDISHFYSF